MRQSRLVQESFMVDSTERPLCIRNDCAARLIYIKMTTIVVNSFKLPMDQRSKLQLIILFNREDRWVLLQIPLGEKETAGDRACPKQQSISTTTRKGFINWDSIKRSKRALDPKTFLWKEGNNSRNSNRMLSLYAPSIRTTTIIATIIRTQTSWRIKELPLLVEMIIIILWLSKNCYNTSQVRKYKISFSKPVQPQSIIVSNMVLISLRLSAGSESYLTNHSNDSLRLKEWWPNCQFTSRVRLPSCVLSEWASRSRSTLKRFYYLKILTIWQW